MYFIMVWMFNNHDSMIIYLSFRSQCEVGGVVVVVALLLILHASQWIL